ncbi:MAG: MFS transporter [Desulfobacteraceae bacterium]|nr:MFS transporter [Desulfobacteraceae bacterium]
MEKNNKNLNLILAGQFVSQVGDKFYMLALSFMVLHTTGSTAKMGMVLAAALIPSLILGLVAGTLIDRCNRKMIIVGADFFRGIIISFVAFFYYVGFLNFYMIIISQALLSVNSAFFDPTVSAVIPQIVEEDELIKANSKHQFINGISTIIGPAAGGIFIASFGYTMIFTVNAVSFFLSAIFEMFLKLPSNHRKGKIKAKFTKELVEGYRYIFKDRSLMILLFTVGVIHFFVGYIEVLMPVLAISFKDNGPQVLGLLHASFGFGSILIALVLSIRTLFFDESKALFISIFLIGIIFILIVIPEIFSIKSAIVYLPLFVLLGGSIILAGVSFKTLLQKNVEIGFSGRVFSIASSIGNSSIPLAMIIFGFLLEFYSFHNLLYVCGLVLLPISIIAYKLYKGSNNG